MKAQELALRLELHTSIFEGIDFSSVQVDLKKYQGRDKDGFKLEGRAGPIKIITQRIDRPNEHDYITRLWDDSKHNPDIAYQHDTAIKLVEEKTSYTFEQALKVHFGILHSLQVQNGNPS
ncbi:MAG: hypothetical protein ABIH72_05235 [archaeon]